MDIILNRICQIEQHPIHKWLNDKIHGKKEKKIIVVANVSAGKSTLINALVGLRINRTKMTACTNRLMYIHNMCCPDGIIAKRIDGSYCYFDDLSELDYDSIIEAAFPFKSTLKKQPICFIDTPGINNAEDSNHRCVTEKAINTGDYDIVIYVSNGLYFGTNDEHNLLKYLRRNVRKPIIFVLNRLDEFNSEQDSIAKMLKDYKSELKKMGFKRPTIVPISAYASFLFRIDSSLTCKTEERKKHEIKELFEEDYYDFPTYIGCGKSKDLLTKTGIETLENKILTLKTAQ